MKALFSLTFTFFLLMDPIGNIPLYISLLKDLPEKRQRTIIIRELFLALFTIFLFYFIGDVLFDFLKVSNSSIQITGGIVLFLISLKMIFPSEKPKLEITKQEPFFVPLAVPLVAGPSILAAVMLYGGQESRFVMLASITMAWLATLVILVLSPPISRFLKTKGIVACERLMGLILVMISVQMFLDGIDGFFHINR